MEQNTTVKPIQKNEVQKSNNSISYVAQNGTTIELSTQIIKNLTSDNALITNGEIELFINMCKYQKLNPLIREAYLVKYDTKKPAQQIVSLGAFLRISDEHPQFDGMEDGIIVQRNNEMIEKVGTMVYTGETLIGAWARVYRKDRSRPTITKISLKEFNKGQSTWNVMPAVMINKCAKVNALRTAFPSCFTNCYSEEELTASGTINGTKEQPTGEIYDTPQAEDITDKIENYNAEITQEEISETYIADEFEEVKKESTSEFACEMCGAEINEKVYNFSKSKYNKPLCFNCQKKVK